MQPDPPAVNRQALLTRLLLAFERKELLESKDLTPCGPQSSCPRCREKVKRLEQARAEYKWYLDLLIREIWRSV